MSWTKVREKKTIPPYRPNFRHSNFDTEYTSIPINFQNFEKNRTSCISQFSDFDFNLIDDIKPMPDIFDSSTQSSRNINNSSPLIEEHNSTKVKLFLPSVSPKIFNVKDIADKYTYSKHRRSQNRNYTLITGNSEIIPKNLVEELRAKNTPKEYVNNSKFRLPSPLIISKEIMDSGDDLSSANEIPEFLKKVEVSRLK